MAITTLEYAYLTALREYIMAMYDANPSELEGITFAERSVHVGRHQASPVTEPPIISLHVGNPLDTSAVGGRDWRHELDPESAEIAGPSCTAGIWYYRYTCQVRFFMTRTKETQVDALERGSRLAEWLHYTINAASVRVLQSYGLPVESSFGERALTQKVVSIESSEEGGPPASYITRHTLFIEQVVHHS